MVAKSSGPFGTKRSQVQILSPRPKICLKITIFRLFCCLILLYFLSEIPYSLSKSGFQRTCPFSASIGWQLIEVDLWNCVSGFGELFRSGMFIEGSGWKWAGGTGKKVHLSWRYMIGQPLLVFIKKVFFRHIHMQLCLITRSPAASSNSFPKNASFRAAIKPTTFPARAWSPATEGYSQLFVLAFGHQEPTYSAEGQDYRLGCSSTA